MPKVVMNIPEMLLGFSCECQTCKDKCCNWFDTIYFSQKTYEVLEKCENKEVRLAAEALKINELANTKYDYAFIKPEGACPFLTEAGLCRVKTVLGQKYMGHPCRAYPQIYLNMGEGLDVGLAPSCPQVLKAAATLTEPLKFTKVQRELESNMTSSNYTDIYELYSDFVPKLRQLLISLLQNRKYSIPKRLLLAEALFNHLDDLFNKQGPKRGEFLETYNKGLSDSGYETLLKNFSSSFKDQLIFCCILRVSMLKSEHNDFVDQVLEFVNELFKDISTDSPEMDDITERYKMAQQTYYEPFIEKHEHFIENVLVLEAFSYGMPLLQFRNMCDCVLFLTVYFSMIRFLICMHSLKISAETSLEDAIKIVQGVAKRFEETINHYDDDYNGVLTRTKLVYVFTILKKFNLHPISLINGMLGTISENPEKTSGDKQK